jgi:hypothetical protein
MPARPRRNGGMPCAQPGQSMPASLPGWTIPRSSGTGPRRAASQRRRGSPSSTRTVLIPGSQPATGRARCSGRCSAKISARLMAKPRKARPDGRPGGTLSASYGQGVRGCLPSRHRPHKPADRLVALAVRPDGRVPSLVCVRENRDRHQDASHALACPAGPSVDLEVGAMSAVARESASATALARCPRRTATPPVPSSAPPGRAVPVPTRARVTTPMAALPRAALTCSDAGHPPKPGLVNEAPLTVQVAIGAVSASVLR